MINQLSAVSSQQSDIKDNAQWAKDNKVQDPESGIRNPDINKREDFKKVAREMESLFAYQLLKVMRETNNNLSADNNGSGKDTYMSLFDMEISKMFAGRGLGLQDAIINWLEGSSGTPNNNMDNNE